MLHSTKRLQDQLSHQFFVNQQRRRRKQRAQALSLKEIFRRINQSSKASRRKRKTSENPRNTHPNFVETPWGKLIYRLSALNDGNGPNVDSRDGMLFRRRFRVPWPLYCKLVVMCQENKLFGENSNLEADCCQSEICPITIKLLGVLRILGRNWLCDDVAEATGMGEATIRTAFVTFCTNFVKIFYDKFIYRPIDEKLKRMMAVYSRMGLDGLWFY
jgi:hypothetical protein